MDRLGIHGLPHLVNALIMISIFSAGNGQFYASSRQLYGLALDGKAPKQLLYCTKAGVPWVAIIPVLGVCFLGMLQIHENSAKVLDWLVELITACQLLNYLAVAITYLHFRASLNAQGVSRVTLPYKGRLQPWAAYAAIFGCTVMLLVLGFEIFFPGEWTLRDFFLNYTMLVVFPGALYVWKFVNKTRYVRPGTADLTLGGLRGEIDEYEELFVSPKVNKAERTLNWFFD